MKSLWYSLIIMISLLFVGCADAGKDQVVTSATNVTLDGSASTTEVNGKIEKYKWKQIEGKQVKLLNKRDVKASFIAPTVLEDTLLVFELVTVEKGGYISPLKTADTVEILVQPQTSNNTPPIANIQTSATEIKLNQSVNFDASTSSDLDGEIITYEWTNTDGEIISSDKIFDYTFTSVGDYTITLTITDDGGLSASSSVKIVVNDLIKPVANISVSADTINIGESVTFDASASSDADGQILTYTWKDVDGNELSFEKIYTHTFDTQGQYPIVLTVEDNDGLKHSEEIIITVQAILTSIELTPQELSLEINETANITSTGNYNDGTSLDITLNTPWIISDNTIVSIDDTGTITALKAGTATIKTVIEDVESNLVTITVTEPVTLQAIQISPNPITLRVNKDTTISIKGLYSDGTIKDIEESITYEIANTAIATFDGINTLSGLETGETTLTLTVGDISSSLIPVKVNQEIITTNFDFTHFGTQYIDQIPNDATVQKYDEKLFSMLTGKIVDEDGNPLSNVKVSIHNNSQYGSVETNANGSYVIPVEGGKYLTVRYEKTGYTTIDRKVYAQPEDWAIADDVTMLKIDEKVTTINLNDSTPQIHSSTIVTDDRGSRATTLVFNGVTQATVKSPDGSTRTLDSINVRATEFKTPESMPSDLPIETAYTYCSDITVDGVKDDESVEFNAPVIMYVDNFLGFEVGEIVPVGYYDRNQGKWIGSKNGAVVKFLDTNNDGKIDSLDATGDGIADDLDGDGTTSSEVKGIEDNPSYQVGMTYWRGEIMHFTPWDFNWPLILNKNVKDPEKIFINNQTNKNEEKEPICSYVNTKERVYHEDINISGTNLTLHYSSKRVGGYKHVFELSDIDTPHLSAKSAEVKLYIAGRLLKKEIDLNNFKKNLTFEWDGKDKLGNHITKDINVTVKYQVNYEGFYARANGEFVQAWAERSSIPTSIRSRDEIGLESVNETKLNMDPILDYKNSIANGWSLSNHNRAIGEYIQKGDGSIEKSPPITNRSLSSIDNKNIDFYTSNWIPNDLAFGIDGYLYFLGVDLSGGDLNSAKIIKFDSSNNYEVIGGEGTHSIKDGVNIKDTKFNINEIFEIGVDIKNNLYFSTGNQIKKIDNNGNIFNVVGTGESGFSGDYGLATSAKLYSVGDIEFDKYGNMYIIDRERVRKIDTNGIITTIAGNDNSESLGDGGLAVNSTLSNPSDLAIDSKGNVYILEFWNTRVRKIDTNGIITTIAGTGENGFSGDGALATNAKLRAYTLDVDIEGNIYLAGNQNPVIRFIDSRSGIITSIINKGLRRPSNIIVGKNKDLYIGDESNIYKSKIKPIFNTHFGEDVRAYKNIDSTVDIYHAIGIHQKTIDQYTKNTLKEFKYDVTRMLTGVIDQFGNEIVISRDEKGNPTEITAPNGQKTYLTIDLNGDLVNVSYEDNSKYTFEYIEGSLLSKTTFPDNGTAIMLYDENGRIIEEIDPNNAKWTFGKNIAETYLEYIMTKPEGDKYSYKDFNLENGFEKSENITPCGDVVTITTSGDEKNVSTITNGVIENNIYTIDEKTGKKILDTSITTQPSGLKRITTYDTKYVDNTENVTLSKTQTIKTNNKAIVVKSDYENATNTITTPEGRVSKSEYNINTRLTSKTTSGTLIPTTYTYDSKGRVSSETTGTRTTSYTYNPRGNINTVTDGRGKTTSYEYDILDRVTKVTYPNGTIENYTYDVSGNMTRLVTPVNTNHDFTYDNIGQRKSMNSPLNKLTSYTYNGNRKLTQISRPSGKTVVNKYVNDKLATTTTAESVTSYDYIFNNKIGSITKGAEKVEFTYDGDLLTSLAYTGELNQTLSYSYNNDFLPTSFTYAGTSESYAYDNDNLLLSSGDYTLTRDSDNDYVTKLTDGSLVQDYTYDNYGELTKLSNNSFAYEITAKDNSSLITQKTETINNTTTTYDYTYDDNSRLVKVLKDNTIVESYSYDNNGNRLSATVNGITTSASYTLDDQLEVYGNNTYRYDDDGYLQEKTTPDGVTTYSYSTLGELKTVITPTQTIEYKHNANNQRVAKLVNGVVVEKYLWANLTTLLAIYDKDDNLVQRFEYVGSRMPISMTQDSQKYYLHYDQVGSLRAVSDSSHNIIKEVVYDSFGNILSDSNESFKVTFGFAGGLYDSDTKLTRFGYRDYDSYTGKWTAKDPIDFFGGDSNLYGYVLNDPVNFIDPLGLWVYIVRKIVWSLMTWAAMDGDPDTKATRPLDQTNQRKGEEIQKDREKRKKFKCKK